MRLVVVGASGLVGGHVMEFASRHGHPVMGVARNADGPRVCACPAGNLAEMEMLIRKFSPDAVLFAAGFTWADGCEADPARSRRENVENPSALAKLCNRLGIRFVYYSSSYVFDGASAPYDERAPLSPLSAYGRDKALAEDIISDVTGGSALVLRLIHVWGLEAKGKNFAYQVRRANLGGHQVVASSSRSGNPTWAGDVAEWTLDLLEASQSGIWHLAGNNPEMTRLDWANAVLDGLAALGHPRRAILVDAADLPGFAPRPARAGLLTAKIQRAFPRSCRPPQGLPKEFA